MDNKHAGVAIAKEIVSNKKKKGPVASESATVHSIGSSTNTHVPSYIFHDKKSSVELVKRDAFRWIFGSVTPFGKTLPPSFCSMFKPILVYTGLIKNTFNTIRDEDCAAFTVCVGTTILECEEFYLGA